MTTTYTAMRNALATFIEYNDNGGPLSFDVDAMWANARAALAGAEGVQAEVETLRQQLAEAQALIDARRNQEPVYAFRRKGLDDFCTCSEKRFLELSSKQNLFEVKKLYAAPVVAPDVQHANLLEVMKDIVQLWDHRCYEHGDGMPSRLHIRAKAAIAAMGGAA